MAEWPAELDPRDCVFRVWEVADPAISVRPLDPSTPSKLARLALARAGEPSAEEVRAAASSAYDRYRPYHAHDAIACALVHPGLDASTTVADLTGSLAGRRQRRGITSSRVLSTEPRQG
ncbi:hypothetical protein GCM10023259_018120 [Thermocatellispora tengchongensis]